jgi:hypothetical protein
MTGDIGAERQVDLLATSLAHASDALIEVHDALAVRTAEAEDARRQLEVQRLPTEEIARALAAERRRADDLEQAVKILEAQLDVIGNSRSWRLTQPLRTVAGLIRKQLRRS